MGWFFRDYGLLLLGLAVLLRVAVSLPSGKFPTKYGLITRGDSPGRFWAFVVGNTLLGFALIIWQVYLWSSP